MSVGHLKLEPIDNNPFRARAYYNGKEVPNVSEISFHVEPLSYPEAEIKLWTGIEYDGDANVTFKETGNELETALAIVRNDLMHQGGDLYKGFKASIISALNEAKNYESNERLADRILGRIIGED